MQSEFVFRLETLVDSVFILILITNIHCLFVIHIRFMYICRYIYMLPLECVQWCSLQKTIEQLRCLVQGLAKRWANTMENPAPKARFNLFQRKKSLKEHSAVVQLYCGVSYCKLKVMTTQTGLQRSKLYSFTQTTKVCVQKCKVKLSRQKMRQEGDTFNLFTQTKTEFRGAKQSHEIYSQVFHLFMTCTVK